MAPTVDMGNLSKNEIALLAVVAREFGRTTPLSNIGAAELFFYLASAGYDAGELLENK